MDPKPGTGAADPHWREWLRRHRAWLLVGLAILFVLAVRVRLRDMALERDEGEYAYAGQLILQGIPPYQEAYNMKLPGTYVAYAVIMVFFGQTPSGIHVGLALLNAVSIALVFLIGRRILDEATGVAAAVAFALLSLSPSVLGLAAHATHFVTFFALAGILALLKAVEGQGDAGTLRRVEEPAKGRTWAILASGSLFGLALLMKQHGVFFGIFGALYLLRVHFAEWWALRAIREQRRANWDRRQRTTSAPADSAFAGPWLRALRDLGWFGLGWVAPYAVTCLVLWGAGILPQFVFWTITYARQYASAISLVNGPEMLRSALHVVVGPNLGFWLLPWIGALVMWWEERFEMRGAESGVRSGMPPPASPAPRPAARVPFPRFFLTLLLFCSFASASVGLYYREHYFITVLPALALLGGVAVSRALHLLKHDTTIELFLAVPILAAFAIAVGAALIGHGAVWCALPSAQAVRSVFGSTLFAETARAAGYLKSHTAKDARVAVLGSEPEIYFLSHRRSATGFIYMYPLMEEQPYALKLQEQMISEIEHARPEYVVYVDDDYSWLARRGAERKVFSWWNDYWSRNLDLVLTLPVEETQRGADMDVPGTTAPASKHILIFKRRR